MKSRAAALVQLRDVLVTAPTGMRERFDAKTLEGKATQVRALRPDTSRLDEPEHAALEIDQDIVVIVGGGGRLGGVGVGGFCNANIEDIL